MSTISTLTTTQETAIRDWLAAHPTLAVGVGTREQACSVAAINLALTGTLTDDIPACMSPVIGRWIIGVQDAMPGTIRNSAAWHDLLPLAAGTGRDHEAERMAMIMHWLWDRVLPTVQPLADARGFGTVWRAMCAAQTAKAAYAAKDAADAAAYACNAANAGIYAGAKAAADEAAIAAEYADYADDAAKAADAAAYAAFAANAAGYAVDDDAWATIDPVGLLQRLIGVTDDRALGAAA